MGAKEKKAKLQIIIFTLLFVGVLFGEIYTMINFSSNYVVMVLLLLMALIAVYVVIDGVILIIGEKNTRREEQYDSILKSEKAAYLSQKKYFEEIEEQLILLEDKYRIPFQEIINAQKGIAKVIISRSKENADAIINSNDQIMERLDELEEAQKQSLEEILGEQKNSNAESKTKMDAKLQDIILHMKDMELRLNQSISQNSKVIVAAQPEVVETPVSEVVMPDENITAEEPIIEEIVEEVAEELPPMPDLSDPNKAMSSDEIAALFANMSAEEPASEEEPVIEEKEETVAVEEELPSMPDLSDPNKAMSPDEIAALIANMSAGEPEVEEVMEEETVTVEEELPPIPDLSDPNKVMSPDEIAALIANL